MSRPTIVDLRSDTVTRPSAGMRAAIADAEVGDDVLGDDPTVLRLQSVAAERLGKEAALFVPSGTMANQIALRLHTRPGDAIVVESGAHIYNYEAGAAAWLWGLTCRTVTGADGVLRPSDVADCFQAADPHRAPTRVVCAEDTANRGGGTVQPLDVLDALGEIAHSHRASAHLDGARLFNAVIASGDSAARRARPFDTISVCLSKGLGAPVGSVLVGPRDLIAQATRVRKALGGGMRQAGVLAAAGLYALDHNIHRIADDHARAGALAAALRGMGWAVRPPPTNMVYIPTADANALVDILAAHGVAAAAASATQVRLVTHLDVTDAGLAVAVDAFHQIPPG